MTLSADALAVNLAENPVLKGVGFTVRDGEMVAVVGPNGSGKSTRVRTLAALLRPASGSATLDGRPVRSMTPRARAARRGLLAQSAETPGLTTVEEHVGLGRHCRRTFFARWGPGDTAAVRDAMATCEVTHLAQRRMENLSGGERQRVRLATLIAQDPDHLLLDEPLTGLDIEHQFGLLHLLRDLNLKRGRTIVCVLHDLDLALRFFDRVLVLHEGRIAADGAPADVLRPGIFRSVFRVEGRIGTESGGEPVIVCRSCPAASPAREDDEHALGAPVVPTVSVRRGLQPTRTAYPTSHTP